MKLKYIAAYTIPNCIRLKDDYFFPSPSLSNHILKELKTKSSLPLFCWQKMARKQSLNNTTVLAEDPTVKVTSAKQCFYWVTYFSHEGLFYSTRAKRTHTGCTQASRAFLLMCCPACNSETRDTWSLEFTKKLKYTSRKNSFMLLKAQ